MNIVNDKVTDYIYGLYRPLSDELADLRAEGERRHVPIILRDSERLLITLIEMNRPERILEIGTAIGYSAAVFATAARQAKVVTIEIDPLYAADARANLIGFDNVTLIEGDAARVMKDMADEGESEKFDFIFIDAAKSHYMEFWKAALGVVKKGGVIVCDNILMQAKTVDSSYDERGRFETNIKYMREFIEHISDCEEATTSILPVGDGMSISVIK
ncbi:MAG: O-methyltransferase [Firmicutes bacterium]|nr:O-methyltransferase [Bacillota bacterium]